MEVCVARDECQPILAREGRDPHVVFWQWPPQGTQLGLELPVVLRRGDIWLQRTAEAAANCWTRATLAWTREELYAPKKSSPMTKIGTNTADVPLSRASTACSVAKMAMTMLVSSRKLPLGWVDAFTLLLNRPCHLLKFL